MPQFIILADDYKDENALSRRMAVREDHLARMKEEKDKGNFVIGGARLDDDGKMRGSMLIVNLENEFAVQQWLKVDPYVVGKVWDNIEVRPFKVADV